jgi:hypothetical protein
MQSSGSAVGTRAPAVRLSHRNRAKPSARRVIGRGLQAGMYLGRACRKCWLQGVSPSRCSRTYGRSRWCHPSGTAAIHRSGPGWEPLHPTAVTKAGLSGAFGGCRARASMETVALSRWWSAYPASSRRSVSARGALDDATRSVDAAWRLSTRRRRSRAEDLPGSRREAANPVARAISPRPASRCVACCMRTCAASTVATTAISRRPSLAAIDRALPPLGDKHRGQPAPMARSSVE